jgi:hypothetical protein
MALLIGCSEPGLERLNNKVAPTPRRMVVWLDEGGVEAETADRLAASGVDQLVVRRGVILLSGAAPVVQLLPSPPVEGRIPVAVALEVRGFEFDGDEKVADAVWSALEADFGDRLPSELILDLPEIGEGDFAGSFVARLAQQSGLAVIPVLTVSQLQTEAGKVVAQAAHRCIVPVFGAQDADLRGLDDLNTQPLTARLSAIASLGVRVRVAAALRPKIEPRVSAWAEDIDPLTDTETAEIKRTSALDRSFVTRRPLTWGDRDFGVGQSVAVAWVDASRLGLFLEESHRVILPEIEGWDLVTLPPDGPNLGLDRDELIRYLSGQGPAPTIDFRVKRNGRLMTVELVNTSVFRSAITTFGNWVQVELAAGSLVASSRGEFDRVILGSLKSGEWQSNPSGGPDAVRFVETYLAPGEGLKTGSIRLPSSRSRVVVRWQVQLSDGSALTGIVN